MIMCSGRLTAEELGQQYPQFIFSGEHYHLGSKTYIRAEYRDEHLAELVGDYYYCFDDGNFILVEDFNDLMLSL